MKSHALKTRLLTVVLLLTLLPLISSLYVSIQSMRFYQKSIRQFSENILREKLLALDKYYLDINRVLQQMVDQNDTMEFLSSSGGESPDFIQQRQSGLASRVESVLSLFQDPISAVYIIPADSSRQMLFRRSNTYGVEPVDQYLTYGIQDRILNTPVTLWTYDPSADIPFLSAARRVYSAQRDQTLGYMLLRLNYGYLAEILGCTGTSDILLRLKDAGGRVIYSWGMDPGPQNDSSYYPCSDVSGVSSWSLECRIPYDQFDRQLDTLRLYFLVEIPLLLLLAVLSFFLLRKWVYQPVRQVNDLVRDFSLTESTHRPSADEFQEITDGFEQMRLRISSLVADMRQEDEKRSQLEIQMLQLQIMPHFLLNTLNTVKSLLALGQTEKAETMLQAFMEMLHMSLSDVRSIVSLNEEINYLHQYITVMSIRRDTDIRFLVSVPPDCQGCAVPKYILQPVVENSILHGFRQKTGRTPTISVSARREEDRLTLVLEDNGIGMTAEKLSQINDTRGHFSGIGLSNVRNRLQLLYGTGGTLHVHQADGRTQVILTFPFRLHSGQDSEVTAGSPAGSPAVPPVASPAASAEEAHEP